MTLSIFICKNRLPWKSVPEISLQRVMTHFYQLSFFFMIVRLYTATSRSNQKVNHYLVCYNGIGIDILKYTLKIWLALSQAVRNISSGILVPNCIFLKKLKLFSFLPPGLFFFEQRFPFNSVAPITCSPISSNSACPVSRQMNMQFA